jgi:hypothetical protein
MPTQENTNVPSLSLNSIDDSTRCQHRTPSGRRCKQPVEAPGKLLCYTHLIELKKSDVFNLKNPLLIDSQGFQTAQGINYALGNLYRLLANNCVSPRRAAVLAYINSLLLRTLPAIDAEYDANNEADITDPDASEEATPESAPTDTTTDAPRPSPAATNTAPVWDAIPEPDITKKPS